MAHYALCLLSLCLILGINGEDDKTVRVNNANVNIGRVQCWECTVVKDMDNRITAKWDNIAENPINTPLCPERSCEASEDWCLVTYYRMMQNGAESKRERFECGNRDIRERDTVCQALLDKDRSHNYIQDCTTKRAGAASLYPVFISLLISTIMVLVH